MPALSCCHEPCAMASTPCAQICSKRPPDLGMSLKATGSVAFGPVRWPPGRCLKEQPSLPPFLLGVLWLALKLGPGNPCMGGGSHGPLGRPGLDSRWFRGGGAACDVTQSACGCLQLSEQDEMFSAPLAQPGSAQGWAQQAFHQTCVHRSENKRLCMTSEVSAQTSTHQAIVLFSFFVLSPEPL